MQVIPESPYMELKKKKTENCQEDPLYESGLSQFYVREIQLFNFLSQKRVFICS